MEILLANLIRILHIAIIMFILFVPICNLIPLLLLHITFCLSIYVHWACNNNVCALSLVESKLRGIPLEKSFVSNVVSPFYDVPDNWIKIALFVLFFISLIKFIRHPKFKYCCSNYRNMSLFDIMTNLCALYPVQ
jgi:hypothetical protein